MGRDTIRTFGACAERGRRDTSSNRCGALLAGVLGLSLTVGTGTSLAAEPVHAALQVPVSIRAREQPVAEFVGELLGQMGVPVKVDESVRGIVNGDFDMLADDVLERLKRTFQLTYYYDGTTLHVYPVSDVSRDILYLSRPIADQVVENAKALNLPDPTNRLEPARMGLVAVGTRRFHEQVRELVDAVKSMNVSAAAPETFRVFKLKYGWADDVSLVIGGQEVVVPGVARLLSDLVGADGVGASLVDAGRVDDVGRESRRPGARPKLKGQGLQSVSIEGGEPESELEEPVDALTTRPDARGSGRATIVADPLNNAIVIRDRADRMGNYERLIATLDVEPMMVEIEATIIDMNTDRLRELGIDWRLRSGETRALLGEQGTDLTPIGNGGIVSLVLGDRTRFISRIRALENQGAARIVSKPHVITLANVEALLDSTETFFVRVEGDEEVDLFDVSVGTTMRVTPHIHKSRGRSQIKMLVGIEDGNATDRTVDQIPVIKRSTINTQALVEEGQSLLIGGLIRDSDQNNVSKVPFFGDLPGVGALFRSNSKSARRTERLFLITPRMTALSGQGDVRLDLPVLSGEEGDIVRSAPLRLAVVKEALAERDARFPVLGDLPEGRTEAGLAGAPKRAPLKLWEQSPPTAPTNPSPASDEPLPVPEDVPVRAVTTAARAPGANRFRPEGTGWEEVPGSRPTR